MKTTKAKKQEKHGTWLTLQAIKAVRSKPEIRRAIEDYYGVKGFTTVSVWLTTHSQKIMHENVLKIIASYMKKEVSEIIETN